MLRVLIDADVLFAGAASPSDRSASLVVLLLSEMTVIEGIVSAQVVDEAQRNLQAKVPAAVPRFNELVERCVDIVDDPSREEVLELRGLADPKDAPILAAAVREGCDVLVTFNERDYQPGHKSVEVLAPGVLVQRVRRSIAALATRRSAE